MAAEDIAGEVVNSLVQDAAAAGARVGLKSDEIVIRGGKPLVGRIEVRGAKNLATKAMVASLLGDTPSILKDVPDISDVKVVRGLLEVHGVRITDPARGELILDPSNVESAHFAEIDAHAGSSRIPILFCCGPLLHKLGEAFIPDLGGCRIGDRPIDFHLDALRAMGAVVDKQLNGIHLTAPNGLKVPRSSCRTRASARPSRSCSRRCWPRASPSCATRRSSPIMDLIAILQKMGAIVTVEPSRTIFIEGVESLAATRTARSTTATRPPAGPPPRSPPTATSSSRVRTSRTS